MRGENLTAPLHSELGSGIHIVHRDINTPARRQAFGSGRYGHDAAHLLATVLARPRIFNEEDLARLRPPAEPPRNGAPRAGRPGLAACNDFAGLRALCGRGGRRQDAQGTGGARWPPRAAGP
ncbi:MAG: hypothetical protein ACREYC_20925 [Gammaproteobacteria bacterium]